MANFRVLAAADQLQTWGERVGAYSVRGPEAGVRASVAFVAVKKLWVRDALGEETEVPGEGRRTPEGDA